MAQDCYYSFQAKQVFSTNVSINKFLHHAGPQHAHFVSDLGVEYLDARIVHEIYQMFKDVSEILDKNKSWNDNGIYYIRIDKLTNYQINEYDWIHSKV